MGRAKLFHSRMVSSNNLLQIAMADLLERLSLKHCNLANVKDAGIAVSKILVTHCNTAILRRDLNIKHFEKEKIYQPNPNQNNFLPNLQINSMDIPLLYKLITCISVFPTYLRNQQNLCQRASTKIFCCGQCSHLCNVCNKEDCFPNCPNKINNVWDHRCQTCGETKSQCIEANCNACVNNNIDLQCGIFNLTEGVGTSKENRNTSFHLTLFECRMFIKQKASLNGFPNCHKEEDLFNLITKSFTSILNFLCNVDYFQKDPLSFKNRRQRIKEMNTLLFANEGEIFKDVAKNLSRQCLFLTEHIQRLQSEVTILRDEEECNEVSLLLLTYSQKDCQLMLKGIKVTGISKIKIHQHSHRKIQSVDPSDYNYKYDDVEKVSVINIFHQIEEGSKYDYEVIIEDEQKSKWKASTEQLDPFDANHVELKNTATNNELIKVACNESNTDNKLSIAEKVSFGFKATFNAEEDDYIEAVQCKKLSSASWSKPGVLITCQGNENRHFLECWFPSSGTYKFRVLIRSRRDRDIYRCIMLEDIEIVDENSFQHTSSCGQTMLMFHPYGERNDVHHELKVLPRQKANVKDGMLVAIRVSGGEIAIKDIDELGNYIEQNFRNQNVFSFPPLYMISMDSSYYQIVEKFETYYRNYRNRKAIILSGADLYDNLLTLGYTDEEVVKLCNYTTRTENIFVFDSKQNTVFVINICKEEEANAEALKYRHRQCNNIARLFLTINQHIIGNHHMAIVGVVACLNGSREDAKRMVDSKHCFQQTLTKDDLQSTESFNGWFYQLNLKVNESKRNHHFENRGSNAFVFKEIPNRLLLLSAIKNFNLPATSFGTEEEKLSRLLLNYPQIHAVYDEKSNKKVIKGGYGSGKTLILKKVLEILVTAGIPTIVYYILFDPYSMVNMDINKYVRSIPNSTLAKVFVKNVYQLSCQAKSRNVLNLSQCLQYISNLNPNETTHVLVDEYDEEELTKIEALQVQQSLRLENFKDATVVISVQSVEKHTIKLDENRIPIESTTVADWETAGMKLYNLPHTMRSTNKISNLVETFQHSVAMEKNDIYLPVEPPEEPTLVEESEKEPPRKRSSHLSTLRSLFRFANNSVQLKQSLNEESVPTNSRSVQSTYSSTKFPVHISSTRDISTASTHSDILQPETSIDTLAATSSTSSSYSTRILRSFRFISSKPGHTIIGTQPKLLRLESCSYIDVSIVQYYIQNYCFNEDQEKEAVLFICNNISLMQSFVKVFSIFLSLNTVEYFDSILNNQPPSFEKQKNAYDKLMNIDEKNLLVLTDIRGCRGLEYRKVICVVDESNEYERHMLVEGLSRATSQLYILSIRGKRNDTNISKIMDNLVKDEYVDNVTAHCTIATADEDERIVEIKVCEKQDKSTILKKKYDAMTFQRVLEEEDIYHTVTGPNGNEYILSKYTPSNQRW